MFLRGILQFLTWFSFKAFENNCRRIERVQSQRWDKIKRNIGVEGELSSYRITDYEDYRSRIEAGKFSDTCPLTGHPVQAWLKTSGTTNVPKTYPLTKIFQKELQRLGGPFLYSMLRQRKHFLKKNLLFISSPREYLLDNGLPFCPISYFNYITRPFFIRFRSTVKDYDLRDEQSFFNDVPVRAMADDLDTMMAIMPEVIVRFFNDIKNNFDSYYSRLDDFGCTEERKEYLAKLRGTEFNISDLWPDLKSIFCWKASICALQLPSLERLLDPKVKIIDAFYTTTEGSFTIAIDQNRLGGPLDPNGHVVEFLPLDKKPEKDNLLKPWELKEGESYEVVVTTSMGLVRYRLYDIVECRGFFQRSPWLVFKQKVSGEISLGHTRFSEEHLSQGLAQATYQLQPEDFFAPFSDGKGLVFYSNSIDQNQVERLNQYMYEISPQFLSDIENDYIRKIETQPVPRGISNKRLPQQKQKLLHQSPPTL